MPPKSKKSAAALQRDPPVKANTAEGTATPRISWPALALPPPALRDLSIETLVPSQIYLIPSFFPSSLCTTFTRFLASLPLVTTPSKAKRGEAVRVNDRFQVQDETLAKDLWTATGLSQAILGGNDVQDEGDAEAIEEEKRRRQQASMKLWGGEVVGLNPNIRIYRYKKDQFFDKHYDDSNILQLPLTDESTSSTAKLTKCHTTYTLLLYLTAPPEVTGGETIFYNELPRQPGKKGSGGTEVIKVGLEKGMVLLHKHGRDCMLHEGAIVTEGEKWVLRTDLVVRG